MLSVYLFGPQGLPRLQSKAKLRKLCAEMADDGFLSIEKIEEGYDANDDFKNTLQEMGIERQDLGHGLRALRAVPREIGP